MNTPDPATPNGKRRRLLLVLAAIFLLAGAGYAAWWAVHGRYHEKTDDAYVAGDIVQITPQTAGTVIAVYADDTEFVRAGAPLVRLDPADAKVALDAAEADLSRVVREVRGLFSGAGAAGANVARSEADVARAREDLARRQSVAGSGAVSAEEVQHARDSLRAAEAALGGAREQLAAQRAPVQGTRVDDNPTVARAAARVREAYLAWARSALPAPLDGVVARRSVQVGQRVAPGNPLMAVVPLDRVWVDANFKEVQVEHMRIGQPVTLQADIYGSGVRYHGRIVGLGAGTGAVFALLPPQNATGNWIKVVQRVPVRIALDVRELTEHPLRLGLSVTAEVDTHDRSGSNLAGAARPEPRAITDVYAQAAVAADARVQTLIAAFAQGRAAPRLPDAPPPAGAKVAAR